MIGWYYSTPTNGADAQSPPSLRRPQTSQRPSAKRAESLAPVTAQTAEQQDFKGAGEDVSGGRGDRISTVRHLVRAGEQGPSDKSCVVLCARPYPTQGTGCRIRCALGILSVGSGTEKVNFGDCDSDTPSITSSRRTLAQSLECQAKLKRSKQG